MSQTESTLMRTTYFIGGKGGRAHDVAQTSR